MHGDHNFPGTGVPSVRFRFLISVASRAEKKEGCITLSRDRIHDIRYLSAYFSAETALSSLRRGMEFNVQLIRSRDVHSEKQMSREEIFLHETMVNARRIEIAEIRFIFATNDSLWKVSPILRAISSINEDTKKIIDNCTWNREKLAYCEGI